MELEIVTFTPERGWSSSLPQHLDTENTAVFVFGAAGFLEHDAPLLEIRRALPKAHIIGCSTAGEIVQDKIMDGTLVVAAAAFERTRLRSLCIPIDDATASFDTGRRLAEALNEKRLRGLFVLSEGLGVNGSALARGMSSVLDASTRISGGLAADGEEFARTWTLRDGTPVVRHVGALGLYGDDVQIRHGSRGGWDIFGPERRVTRSEGNVLHELDGKPALGLYKTYLGQRADGLPATALLFPLSIRLGDSTRRRLVRTVLGVDEATGTLTFAGDIPQGSLAQLMRANFDRLVEGAHAAALDAGCIEDARGDQLSIAISCVGRRMVLGARTEEETEAILDVLGAKTHQIGFYSYGEISSCGDSSCELHNQSMTLTMIAER